MHIRKAVVTAAGPDQGRLPLQRFVGAVVAAVTVLAFFAQSAAEIWGADDQYPGMPISRISPATAVRSADVFLFQQEGVWKKATGELLLGRQAVSPRLNYVKRSVFSVPLLSSPLGDRNYCVLMAPYPSRWITASIVRRVSSYRCRQRVSGLRAVIAGRCSAPPAFPHPLQVNDYLTLTWSGNATGTTVRVLACHLENRSWTVQYVAGPPPTRGFRREHCRQRCGDDYVDMEFFQIRRQRTAPMVGSDGRTIHKARNMDPANGLAGPNYPPFWNLRKNCGLWSIYLYPGSGDAALDSCKYVNSIEACAADSAGHFTTWRLFSRATRYAWSGSGADLTITARNRVTMLPGRLRRRTLAIHSS